MRHALLFLGLFFLGLVACDVEPIPTPPPVGVVLDTIPYDPQPYNLVVPANFPTMPIPAENPLTIDGVALGRRLFYDKILSADSSMACASCHGPIGNFTDNMSVSKGIDHIAGNRSSMALENSGFFVNGLFWDGRATTLEEQAIQPIENEIELHDTWSNVVAKLAKHPTYPRLFRKAFGITKLNEITKDLATQAIAQFERTLVSSGTSKFDLALTPGSGVFFTDQEQLGYELFFQLGADLRDAQCGHCHSGPLLGGIDYFNNGLDEAATSGDFLDKGRGVVTGIASDNGKFRTPSLRNIALSGPYMHDGRFQTLEQVVEHYASGGKYADNLSVFMLQMQQAAPLTVAEKAAVIAFLNTLTDTAFINNPAYQNPF